MRLGDAAGPDVPGSGVSDGPVPDRTAAVPIAGRRPSGGTTVLDDDAVAPPWLRMPPVRLVAVATRPPVPEPTRRQQSHCAAVPRRERGSTAISAGHTEGPDVHRPAPLPARPRVVEEPGILGLSRLTRGQVGSRLFTLFFVAVFTLIAVQMVVELLHG